MPETIDKVVNLDLFHPTWDAEAEAPKFIKKEHQYNPEETGGEMPIGLVVKTRSGSIFFNYLALDCLPDKIDKKAWRTAIPPDAHAPSTLVAGISTILLCFFIFRKEIPKKILVGEKINPIEFIRSKSYSIIGLSLLFLMFVLLFISDFSGIEIWKITSLFAIVFLLLNLYFGFRHQTNQKTNKYQQSKTKNISEIRKNPQINEFTMVLHRYPYKIFPLIVTSSAI